MNKGLEQILQNYHENRLSHAFLIETNDQEQCFQDLKRILCEINCEKEYQNPCSACNMCHLLEIENLPSFMVIRPDGQNIRKSQITEMKNRFSTKPIFSKYHMYVIMHAEKMNSSSANMILKFLEEPEDQILGFFITNNKENMIDTIKSRCQIFSHYYSTAESVEEDIFPLAIQLLKNIHMDSEFALMSNRRFLEEKINKDAFQQILRYIIDIYFYFYELKFQMESQEEKYVEVQFLKKMSSENLLYQLNLVSELEKQLNYNVNLNLLLDRLALETRLI